MACASRSRLTRRLTAAARESALWSGPSWAAAIFRCLAIDELPQFARRSVERCGGGGQRPGHAAREVPAGSALDFQLIVFNHDAAAAEHDLGPALVDVALVGRIADRVVHHRVVDLLLELGIPDRDIGVRANRDGALPRVEAVHA